MTALPASMRIIDVANPGGPEVLRVAIAPVPSPGTGEVLIRTVAAGVNRADLLQRQGHYPPPPGASPILGMEVSGYIAALGPGTSLRWRVGDAVCALLAGGGYAEFCAGPEGQCMSAPSSVSIRDAANEISIKLSGLLQLPDEPFAPEVMARLIRMTGGNFRLLTRLLIQIERVLEVNNLHVVSTEVIEAARDSLVIGQG
jgi:hypothetical protein